MEQSERLNQRYDMGKNFWGKADLRRPRWRWRQERTALRRQMFALIRLTKYRNT